METEEARCPEVRLAYITPSCQYPVVDPGAETSSPVGRLGGTRGCIRDRARLRQGIRLPEPRYRFSTPMAGWSMSEPSRRPYCPRCGWCYLILPKRKSLRAELVGRPTRPVEWQPPWPVNSWAKTFCSATPRRAVLYFDYAREMPIFDYHCHLPPEQIAANHRFANLTEIWLGGDHYKWRVMRALGVPEELITGAADDRAKFHAWAQVVPYTVRNPVYHWTHMELRRPFRDLRNCSRPANCRRRVRPVQRAAGERRAASTRAHAGVRCAGRLYYGRS